MLDAGVLSFAVASLPPAPARVLEVGAGEGELAAALASAGYDMLAIDPASSHPGVRAVALADVDEPPRSFDAALAVVSLHHVEPLGPSCRRLAELVRPGGRLVADEIDVERFDEPTIGWWLEHRGAHHEHAPGVAEILDHLHHHCHGLDRLRAALDEWFELEQPTRGPYLYRWELPPELRETEVQLIAAGRLPATGARFVGVRRADGL